MHIFKQPVFSPTAHVNSPDIHHPKFSFNIDPQHGSQLGGKSFGFVGIDIECKNISISGDIGGLILSTK